MQQIKKFGLADLADANRRSAIDGMFNIIADEGARPKLSDDYGVYMTNDAQINLCGVNAHNVEYLCSAYKAVTAP